MAKFFHPETLYIGSMPVIVYPDENIVGLLPQDPEAIRDHLNRLYSFLHLGEGFVNMGVLWADKNKISEELELMTDVRELSKPDTQGSGALTNIRTFRRRKQGDSTRYELDTTVGTGAEFGDMVYGIEAQHRLITCGGDLEKFLAKRPDFPEAVKNLIFNGRKFYELA